MATYTSNYAWTKPGGNDQVDISVLNANLDSQDGIMHKAFTNMAQAFSAASTYAVGDIVLYDNELYKCHTAVTVAGAWTGSTNWTSWTLAEGGGGTSDYPDLTNKPQINGNTLSGNKTSADLGLQDTIQLATMPTASATYVDKIVQFVGETDANYTHGYFYECTTDGSTYSWNQTNIQPNTSASECMMSDGVTSVEDALSTLTTTTVTTGAGAGILIYLAKIGHVCTIRLADGTYTAAANNTLVTLPEGFRPLYDVDVLDTFGRKRIFCNPQGVIVCNEALNNTSLRGSFTYITAD